MIKIRKLEVKIWDVLKASWEGFGVSWKGRGYIREGLRVS